MMGDNRGESADSREWGPIPKDVDHRQGVRHLLAAEPDRHPLAACERHFRRGVAYHRRAAWQTEQRRHRSQADGSSAAARAQRPGQARPPRGRRLFAFDRELGCRFVAGADEAGRGSLAGPLVAAAVLFDLERLTLSDRRALSRLNDSKQHTIEAREELYPLVLRAAADR